MNKKIRIFDNNKLIKEFEKVKDSDLSLNIFIRLLKQNREDFLTWYKDRIEKYESSIPKAILIKNEALFRCDEYIKKGLFIKFMNGNLTLYDINKEKEYE